MQLELVERSFATSSSVEEAFEKINTGISELGMTGQAIPLYDDLDTLQNKVWETGDTFYEIIG